jgi:hypothetical protein
LCNKSFGFALIDLVFADLNGFLNILLFDCIIVLTEMLLHENVMGLTIDPIETRVMSTLFSVNLFPLSAF